MVARGVRSCAQSLRSVLARALSERVEVMTIFNFDWAKFCGTFHDLNWYEAGMIGSFVLAELASMRRLKRTDGVEGRGALSLFLTIVGAAIGVAFKLFVFLDVTALLYIALLAVAIGELTVGVATNKRKAQEDSALKLSERRKVLSKASGESGERHSHRRRHSHEHGGSSGNHESHGRSHAHSMSHSEKEASQRVKEPLYEDPLDDDE